MSKFLESEKPHQSAFKQSSPTITPEARQPGLYKTKYRSLLPAPTTCRTKPLPRHSRECSQPLRETRDQVA
jgi:hypothetical protein